MAVTQRYFPTKESEQVIWLQNFRTKIATHGPTLGLTAGQVTDVQADLLFLIWLMETARRNNFLIFSETFALNYF